MIRVGVSGAHGRMGKLVATAINEAGDLELSRFVRPGGGSGWSGRADGLRGSWLVGSI